MTIRSYRDLHVWQKSMDLVAESYRLSRLLPFEEHDGLVGQIRRAATSVPANIAEGHGRAYRREFVHHLRIARGSVTELQTHLDVALRLGYIPAPDLRLAAELSDHTRRMLSALIGKLEM